MKIANPNNYEIYEKKFFNLLFELFNFNQINFLFYFKLN